MQFSTRAPVTGALFDLTVFHWLFNGVGAFYTFTLIGTALIIGVADRGCKANSDM